MENIGSHISTSTSTGSIRNKSDNETDSVSNSSFSTTAPVVPVKALPVRNSSLNDLPWNRRYLRPSLGMLKQTINGLCTYGNQSFETLTESQKYLKQIWKDMPRMYERISDEINGFEVLSHNEFLNLRKEIDILLLKICRLEAQILMADLNTSQETMLKLQDKLKICKDRFSFCQRIMYEHMCSVLLLKLDVQSQKLNDSDLKCELLNEENERLKTKCNILSIEIEKLKDHRQLNDTMLSDESLVELANLVYEKDEEIHQLKEFILNRKLLPVIDGKLQSF